MSGAKAMKHRINDEFQIKGYWRLPNSTEEVSGILFYTHERITLELIGCIDEDDFFLQSGIKHDTIFGFSDKGEKFSLFNVQLIESPFSAPGFTTQTFYVNEFIVGGHFEKKNDITLNSMVIFPTYLAEWINRNHYKKSFERLNGRNYLKSIEWEDAENFKVNIQGLDFLIEEVDNPKITTSSQTINWKNETCLRITPNKNQNIEWYRQIINSVRILLTTLINKPVYDTSIIYYGDFDTTWNENESKIRHQYMHFRTLRKMNIEENFKFEKSLIKFDDIKDNIDVILNNWFSFRENYKIVLELYSEEFYKPMYVNSSFLSYVQALEIYHRVKSENSGKKINLRTRLTELVESLGEASKLFLIGEKDECEKFIAQLVDTRNFLTHYEKGSKKNIIEDTHDLFNTIMMLKGLLNFLIIREMGIDEAIIIKRLKENTTLNWYILKARENLKIKG